MSKGTLTLKSLNKLYDAVANSKDIPTHIGFIEKGGLKIYKIGGTKRKKYPKCLKN